MGDSLFIYTVLNSLLFSFIFWILTFAAKLFYMDKYKNYKLNFYECGFKAHTSVKINFSIQYLMLACFLIIYDTEFLILYPVMFNLYSITSVELLPILFFFLLLVSALMIDYMYSVLDWTI